MVIECNEKGTREFYTEFLDTTFMYNSIKKKHDTKLKNQKKRYTLYAIILPICTLAFAYFAAREQELIYVKVMYIVAAAMLAVSFLLSLLVLVTYSKMLKNLMAADKSSRVTVDEDGITLESDGDESVSMHWDDIMVVRDGKHSVIALPENQKDPVIAIPEKYRAEFLEGVRTGSCGKMEII